MQSLASLQRTPEFHLQAVILNNPDVQRLRGLFHRIERMLKEPFRNCAADVNGQLRTALLQVPNDLARTDRVAVAMAGDIVEK